MRLNLAKRSEERKGKRGSRQCFAQRKGGKEICGKIHIKSILYYRLQAKDSRL